MCLAVPAEILEIKGEYAIADFGGAQMTIKVLLTPDVKKGDCVLVHAGFSIEKISKEMRERELF